MTTAVDQIAALTELLNVGMKRAASSLNQMCSAYVELRVPQVQFVDAANVEAFLRQQAGSSTGKITTVRMQFSGAFSGSAELIFPADGAAHLVSLLIGDADSTEVGALKACALMEVGNIVLNGVLGSMADVLTEHVTYEVPTYLEATVEQLMRLTPTRETSVLLAQTHFYIAESQLLIAEQELTGRVNLLFGATALEALLDPGDGRLRSAPT